MSGSAGGWNGKNRGWVLEEFLRPGTLYLKTCLLPMHDIHIPTACAPKCILIGMAEGRTNKLQMNLPWVSQPKTFVKKYEDRRELFTDLCVAVEQRGDVNLKVQVGGGWW